MKIAIASVFAIGLSTAVCAQTQSATSASSTSGPVVVQRVSFENQTGPIPQTTIYTPSNNGLYRINVYMEAVTTNPSNSGIGQIKAFLEYTNDSGTTQSPVIDAVRPTPSTNNAGSGSTFVVRAIANTPMQFSTSFPHTPPVQPYAYSAYVVIELL